MIKVLKITLSLIVILLLLFIVAAFALHQWVDPNDFKGQITDAVKEKTGLELSIEEDLSLSVFPWLGVKTGRIALSQPPAVGKGHFVNVDAVDIRVQLLPLFRRELQVDTILLKKPDIRFIVTTSGKTSLDGLSNTADAANQPDPSTPEGQATTIAALTIAGINITDGHIHYDDRSSRSQYKLSKLNIRSGNLLSSTSAPFSIKGQLSGNDLETTHFSLESQLRLNVDTLVANATKTKFSVKQTNTSLNGSIDDLDFSQKSQQAQIDRITLDARTQDIPAHLSIPSVTIDLKKHQVSISQFLLSALDTTLSGQATLKDWHKMATVKGDISSKPFNAQKIVKQFADYQPSKPSALQQVAFSTRFNGSPKGLYLQDTALTIDNSQLTGNLAIMNFSQPNYRFDFSLNALTIDDYLPLSSPEDEAQTSQKAPPTATEALAAPVALLQSVHANGVLRIKTLSASNLLFTNNHITIASDKKQVKITPKVDLYQGKLDGKITLNRAKGALSIVSKLNNVQLEPLLKDADISDQFSGIGNVSTNLSVIQNKGKPSTKGTIKLAARDGAIKGINIKEVLDKAQNTIDKVRGKSTSNKPSDGSDQTRFAAMTATLNVNNDIITNNDLLIKAPVFRINGKGSVDTKKQTLDYLTSVIIVNTNEGQGGKDLESLKGITIPVRFSGSISAPKYTIDTKAMLKANTKKAAAKEKEKLEGKLLKKLGIDNNAKGNTSSSEKEQREEAKEKLKDKLLKKLF